MFYGYYKKDSTEFAVYYTRIGADIIKTGVSENSPRVSTREISKNVLG